MKHTLYLLVIFTLSSCSGQNEKIRFLSSPDEPHSKIANTIAGLLQNNAISAEVIPGRGSVANLDSLARDRANMTIAENYLEAGPEHALVLPLYPEILHILYKGEKPGSFRELVEKKTVYAGLPGSATRTFFTLLFREFRIDTALVRFTANPFDTADVFAGFGDIISEEGLRPLESYNLYSFSSPDALGKGSLVEAICLKNPQFKPFIIPAGTYGPLNEGPITTVSVQALLICRKDLSEDLIYSVTRELVRNKQVFSRISPLLYTGIREDFNTDDLGFSLHPGARMYRERDLPGFLERYAEVIGLLISAGVGIFSFLYSLAQRQRRKKKNRIDLFYQEALRIRKKAEEMDPASSDLLYKELMELEEKAYSLLVEEKLQADESFRILISLVSQVKKMIRETEKT